MSCIAVPGTILIKYIKYSNIILKKIGGCGEVMPPWPLAKPLHYVNIRVCFRSSFSRIT